VGSVKFNHGDIVLVDSSMHSSTCSVGIVVDVRSSKNLYSGVQFFNSNHVWWFTDNEIELISSSLTANEERANV
jgi:hypothetical protein